MDLAKNKKAFHDFLISDTFEAGIELKGTEVKSCRMHSVSFNDAHARVLNGDLILFNVHIPPYEKGNRYNHNPIRQRRLLMHKKEILKIGQKVKEKGMTIIPLKFYLKNGRVKVEIGLGKGKTHGDKRETLKRKQQDLETKKAMRSSMRE